MADIEQTNLTSLTVDLLSAYFANNTVDSAELPGLIRSTHEALKGIDAPAPEAPVEPEFKPAVSIRASLASKDHIISLVDGKPYKTLKRHLSTNGLTPAEYRERYKLPRDYPMVAPTYSQARRDVAAKLGLGRKPREPAPAAAETPIEAPAIEATPPKPVAKAKAAPKTTGSGRKPKPIAPVAATAPVDAPTIEAVPPKPAVKKAAPKAKSAAKAPTKPGRKPKAPKTAETVAAKSVAKPAARRSKAPAKPATN